MTDGSKDDHKVGCAVVSNCNIIVTNLGGGHDLSHTKNEQTRSVDGII